MWLQLSRKYTLIILSHDEETNQAWKGLFTQ